MEENKENLNELDQNVEITLEPVSVENPTGPSLEVNEEVTPMPEPVPMPVPEPMPVAPQPVPVTPETEATLTPVAEISTNNLEAVEQPKKAKKTGLIVGIVVLLLLVAGAVFFYLYAIDKVIFNKNIDKMMARFIVSEENINNSKKGEVKTLTTIDTTKSDILPKLNYTVDANITLDLEKNMMNIVYSVLSQDKKFDGELFAKDNNVFAKFNAIENKVFDLGDEYGVDLKEMSTSKFTVKEYNKLVTYLNKSINDNADKKDLDIDKVKINVGGKEYNSKKITYTINPKEFADISVSFLTLVKNDKQLVAALSEDSAKTIKDIEKNIADIKKDGLKDFDETINYSVYMDGFTALRHEITSKDDNTSLLYDMFDEAKNKVEKLTIVQGSKNLVEATFIETAENKYDVVIDAPEIAKLTGTYTKDKDNYSLDFKALVNGQELGIIKLDASDMAKDKAVVKLEVSSAAFGLELKSEMISDTTKDVKVMETTGATPFESMTAEEQQKFYGVLMEVFGPLMATQTPETPAVTQ